MNISSTSTKNLNADPGVLVKVENVGKIFCRDLRKSLFYGVKDSVRDLVGRRKSDSSSDERPLREGEFWANKGISFELRRGECLGLIGHNGAGKTTLLKMLNGLIKPDTGSIEMHGKVGALIALGAGFNPVLTGRENIYINGSVLGLCRQEVEEKVDEIIAFAEIGDFIDAPVQSYSSGMQVRLGFAVAVILMKPDILILDEVLAVGDMSFTIKCLNVVRQIIEHSAVVFVSHNVQMVSQFCSDIMLLEDGRVHTHTHDVSKGIEAYLLACKQTVELSGSGEVDSYDEILWTDSEGDVGEPRAVIPEASLAIKLTLRVADTVDQAGVKIILKDNSGRPVSSYVARKERGEKVRLSPGMYLCKFELGSLGLTPGKYHFAMSVVASNPERVCMRKDGLLPFTVSDNGSRGHVWAPLSRVAVTTVQSA